MEFNSIKEYFYKLYNVCYAITLVPLGLFIYLYLKMQVGEINSLIQDNAQILIIQIASLVFVVLVLTIVHLVVRKKMQTVSKEPSLGNRMDSYFGLSIVRMALGVVVSALAAGGLYLTGSEVFSIYFLLVLLWMAYQWPSPKKMCGELKLKGDERELILYKRESL